MNHHHTLIFLQRANLIQFFVFVIENRFPQFQHLSHIISYFLFRSLLCLPIRISFFNFSSNNSTHFPNCLILCLVFFSLFFFFFSQTDSNIPYNFLSIFSSISIFYILWFRLVINVHLRITLEGLFSIFLVFF